jgi:hypothetical protein
MANALGRHFRQRQLALEFHESGRLAHPKTSKVTAL